MWRCKGIVLTSLHTYTSRRRKIVPPLEPHSISNFCTKTRDFSGIGVGWHLKMSRYGKSLGTYRNFATRHGEGHGSASILQGFIGFLFSCSGALLADFGVPPQGDVCLFRIHSDWGEASNGFFKQRTDGKPFMRHGTGPFFCKSYLPVIKHGWRKNRP